MDKNLLLRLIAADSAFLTLREKLIFYKFLVDSTENLSDSDFTSFINSLNHDSISFCVKRVFKRVKWSGKDALKKVILSSKILEKFNIRWTCFDSADFPAMLREMKDPPFMLFYRGNLEILSKKCVSVVGTRRATPAALRAATDFARCACDSGLCVVSGLAFGIDAAAHKGAILSENPATCAVLPSGIDMITPQSHTRLAAKILETGGLILSEYLPGTPSVQFRYVQRNRIVAALSPATVVIQAPKGSGAMITADLALGYNREVLFHSQCFTKEAEAVNQMLKGKKGNSPQNFVDEGAKVINSCQDFIKIF